MRLLAFFLLIFSNTLLTNALTETNNPLFLLYQTCYFATSKITFDSNQTEPVCAYPPATGTLAICLRQYASNGKQYEQAITYFLYEKCTRFSKVPYDDIYNNASTQLLNTSFLKLNFSQPQHSPVTIPTTTFKAYHHANEIIYARSDLSKIYGQYLVFYWFGVMALSMVGRYMKRTGLIILFQGKMVRVWQRHVLLPNLFGNTHLSRTKFIPALLPKRSDALIIFGYLVLHTVALTADWRIDANNAIYGEKKIQVARYLGKSTGKLTFSQLPLIFLFAGRNNILSFLTGFSYDSFIQFHKWTARIMALDAIIHSVCFSLPPFWQHQYMEHIKGSVFLQYGIVATVAASIMCFQSYNWFRCRAYEFFLFTHIVLAIAFVVGGWYHCIKIGLMEWLYCSVAIWAFDRFIRIVRILTFGLRQSEITITGDGTMKITIKRPHGYIWKAKPGQYVFIYFMLPNCFWQSHPFTVIDTSMHNGTITLYVKKKTGTTRKVFDRVSSQSGQSSSIKVLVEGPYGESSPNQKYDNVVLVAGGNGIPGPFAHAVKFAENSLLSNKVVSLYWVTRDLQSIQWFISELEKLKGSNVRVVLYLTRETKVNLYSFCHLGIHNINFDEKGAGLFGAPKTQNGLRQNEKGAIYDKKMGLKVDMSTEKYNHDVTEITNLSGLDNPASSSPVSLPNSYNNDRFTTFNNTGVLNQNESPVSVAPGAHFPIDAISINNLDLAVANNVSLNGLESTDFTKDPYKDDSLMDFCEVRLSRPDIPQIVQSTINDASGSISFTSCGPSMFCDSLRRAIAEGVEEYDGGRIDYFEESQVW